MKNLTLWAALIVACLYLSLINGRESDANRNFKCYANNSEECAK